MYTIDYTHNHIDIHEMSYKLLFNNGKGLVQTSPFYRIRPCSFKARTLIHKNNHWYSEDSEYGINIGDTNMTKRALGDALAKDITTRIPDDGRQVFIVQTNWQADDTSVVIVPCRVNDNGQTEFAAPIGSGIWQINKLPDVDDVELNFGYFCYSLATALKRVHAIIDEKYLPIHKEAVKFFAQENKKLDECRATGMQLLAKYKKPIKLPKQPTPNTWWNSLTQEKKNEVMESNK